MTPKKPAVTTDAEALLKEISVTTAPMVQRHATAREKIGLAVKELESERFVILSQRDNLRRQVEAIEAGFQMHLDDIQSCLELYERGTLSMTEDTSKPAKIEDRKE